MKRIIVLILVMAAAMLVTSSCKETLPARFETFVNVVEKRCDKFSEADWQKSNEQFEKLVKEYRDNRASFNDDEKARINAAIAKYVKIVTKSGVKSAVKSLEDLGSLITPFLEGVGSFLNGLFGGEN